MLLLFLGWGSVGAVCVGPEKLSELILLVLLKVLLCTQPGYEGLRHSDRRTGCCPLWGVLICRHCFPLRRVSR